MGTFVGKTLSAAQNVDVSGAKGSKIMKIAPKDVHKTIGKHMLADGDKMVFDLKRSHGNYIYDSKHNREFLDFASCFASSPIGYNHPKLLDPEFQKKLAYVAVNKITNSDFYSVEMAEFVDTFSRIAIPDYLPHLFLIEGGALAVENALKVAFDWKIRKNIKDGYEWKYAHNVICFKDAFHGRSGYTLSMTNTADLRKTMYFPKFHNWIKVQNPKIKFPITYQNLDDVIQAEEEAIARIKRTLYYKEKTIAAIVIEPIQSEGGDNHFRPQFFKSLQALADEYELMLILDEIQTGIGATGKMWAHEHFGIEPDIVVFGKKSQICGILCGRKVDEVEHNVFKESSRINSTFGGNIIDMVRFQKYLEIIEEEGLVANASRMGNYFLARLSELKITKAWIDNIRGRGLIIAFDLPTTQIRDTVITQLYEKGMIVLSCGKKSIRFRPALNISEGAIDMGIEILNTI